MNIFILFKIKLTLLKTTGQLHLKCHLYYIKRNTWILACRLPWLDTSAVIFSWHPSNIFSMFTAQYKISSEDVLHLFRHNSVNVQDEKWQSNINSWMQHLSSCFLSIVLSYIDKASQTAKQEQFTWILNFFLFLSPSTLYQTNSFCVISLSLIIATCQQKQIAQSHHGSQRLFTKRNIKK